MTIEIVKKIPQEYKEKYYELARLLEDIIARTREKINEVAIAFSGGLDSSILGYIALKYYRKVNFYVVGFEESTDIKNAIKNYKKLTGDNDLNRLKIIYISDDDVFSAVKDLVKLGAPDILTISFEIPLYFVLRFSEEKYVLSGQGADELFGGYKKYIKNPELMQIDFNRLISITLPFEEKIAMMFNKVILRPYLDEKIVKIVNKLPKNEKIYGDIRKLALRRIGYILGVPEEIIYIEKKAAQYGSGVMKSIKRICKKLNVDPKHLIKVLTNEA